MFGWDEVFKLSAFNLIILILVGSVSSVISLIFYSKIENKEIQVLDIVGTVIFAIVCLILPAAVSVKWYWFALTGFFCGWYMQNRFF